MKVKLRKAEKKDVNEILKLIHELLTYEKLAVPDKNARRRLIKHGFSQNPRFKVLLAEVTEDGIRKIAGYAFYFFTYSTLMAMPTLYLEDIYISEPYRKSGIGKLLFSALEKEAKKNKCGRMDWVVLDWNKNAMEFYNRLGAKHLKGWNYYRLEMR